MRRCESKAATLKSRPYDDKEVGSGANPGAATVSAQPAEQESAVCEREGRDSPAPPNLYLNPGSPGADGNAEPTREEPALGIDQEPARNDSSPGQTLPRADAASTAGSEDLSSNTKTLIKNCLEIAKVDVIDRANKATLETAHIDDDRGKEYAPNESLSDSETVYMAKIEDREVEGLCLNTLVKGNFWHASEESAVNELIAKLHHLKALQNECVAVARKAKWEDATYIEVEMHYRTNTGNFTAHLMGRDGGRKYDIARTKDSANTREEAVVNLTKSIRDRTALESINGKTMSENDKGSFSVH